MDASPAIEEDILRSIRRIVRALDLYSRKLVRHFGLSGPQLSCLRLLDLHGPMQSGELATAMGLSPATVTGIVDRLEARGLVRRRRQQDDKRCVLVLLSVRGGRLSRQAPPLLQESISSAVRALAPAEQHNLNRYLHRLDDLMTEAGRHAAWRGDAARAKGDTAGPGGTPAGSDDKERGQ
jgi:DNA-binding MarR family transcriptional regulator